MPWPVWKLAIAYVILVLLAWLAARSPSSAPVVFYDDLLKLGLTAAILAFGLWILSVRPALGLAGLPIVGLLVPIQIQTGTKSPVNASLLLAAAVTVVGTLQTADRWNRDRQPPSSSLAPLRLLAGAFILSFLVGQLPWYQVPSAPLFAQLGGLSVIILSVGVFWISSQVFRELTWLRTTTVLFLVVSALYLGLGLVPGIRNITMAQGVSGSLFWTWLTALSFSQAVGNRDWNPVQRGAAGALALGAMFLTLIERHDWVSGWLPGFIAVFVILTLRAPLLSCGFVCLGGVAAAVSSGSWVPIIWSADQRYSLTTRIEAARVLAELIKKSPVLGFGPANYYHYTPLYSILGWHVNFSSHNNYLDIALQAGFLGLAGFLWFFVALWRISMRLRRLVPQGFPQAYLHGAIGGLAGTMCAGMLGDWVLPFVYNVGLSGFPVSVLGWMFLGGLVALERVYVRGEGART